jgi:glycosyltransferase involved in cell wall biosynthesis
MQLRRQRRLHQRRIRQLHVLVSRDLEYQLRLKTRQQMLTIEQRQAARRTFAQEVRRESRRPPLANVDEPPQDSQAIRVAMATPVFLVGGAEQWIATLSHWLDPDRATVTKVFVTGPHTISDVAVSWLPRWVEVVDTQTIEQDGSFDVLITWGFPDLAGKIAHLTCPTIDVQHGVFKTDTWQSPLIEAAVRAHQQLGTTIVGVNEAVRQNFPERVRDKVVIIPNGSDPGRVYPLVDRDELKASLGLPKDSKIALFVGRISGEKNVQALVDAMEFLDESWHAVIVGPQYMPLERIGPRVHLLPAQRRIGNWLGIADVLCHPSDYESHCFSINEAWLAGLPVVSCDYLVNRLFEERHGPMMWMVPVRPEPAVLAEAIQRAYQSRCDLRVRHAREVAMREYSAPVMGRRWSELIGTLTQFS